MEEHKGKTIAVSGGFDPVHIGHIRLLQEAKNIVGKEGKLIVIANGDSWLLRKKGRFFMSGKDREEILRALSCVDDVLLFKSKSDDVSGALEAIQPDIFANGGDRRDIHDIPEGNICTTYGITMLFNVGGDKIRSSSDLLSKYREV